MADSKLISTLLAHSDMEVILTAIKAYVDKQVMLANGDTTAVANLLNALIGVDDKAENLSAQKTVRAISAEEVAKIVANAPEAFDTLKEIADWIGSGDVAATTAAQMLADIKANAAALAAHNTRLESLEGKFVGENSVDAKIAAAQKAAENHSDALKNTAVSSTSTSGPVTATLGGTVGAPTVTVAVTMATAEEIKPLTDMFDISEE